MLPTNRIFPPPSCVRVRHTPVAQSSNFWCGNLSGNPALRGCDLIFCEGMEQEMRPRITLRYSDLRMRNCDFWSRITPAANPTYRVSKDRKSTRLNSSHVKISYAVFCL